MEPEKTDFVSQRFSKKRSRGNKYICKKLDKGDTEIYRQLCILISPLLYFKNTESRLETTSTFFKFKDYLKICFRPQIFLVIYVYITSSNWKGSHFHSLYCFLPLRKTDTREPWCLRVPFPFNFWTSRLIYTKSTISALPLGRVSTNLGLLNFLKSI
jgi:hypothetical protein